MFTMICLCLLLQAHTQLHTHVLHTVILCSYPMVICSHACSPYIQLHITYLPLSGTHSPTLSSLLVSRSNSVYPLNLAHDVLKYHSKIIYFFNFRTSRLSLCRVSLILLRVLPSFGYVWWNRGTRSGKSDEHLHPVEVCEGTRGWWVIIWFVVSDTLP